MNKKEEEQLIKKVDEMDIDIKKKQRLWEIIGSQIRYTKKSCNNKIFTCYFFEKYPGRHLVPESTEAASLFHYSAGCNLFRLAVRNTNDNRNIRCKECIDIFGEE